MKNYMLKITLEIDLGEFETVDDAATVASNIADEFLSDAYNVADQVLCETDEDGAVIRQVEWN
jgi:hypothetical protein